MYRPPNCSLASFSEALNFIESKIQPLGDSYTYMITGDFNFPNMCWETLSVKPGLTKEVAESGRLLLRLMERYLLNQHVNTPTRVNNILDLFLTNRHDLVLDVLSAVSSISDHKVIKIPLAYSFKSSNPVPADTSTTPDSESFRSLDFSDADFDHLGSLLSNVDWDSIQQSSPDDFGSNFHTEVLKICKENLPSKHSISPLPRRNNTRNNARKKGRLLSRLFALKQHNPSSPAIPVLESKLKEFEKEK